MAIALTEEQKLQKQQQDAIAKDTLKRQTQMNFPANTQIGQDVQLMPIANQSAPGVPQQPGGAVPPVPPPPIDPRSVVDEAQQKALEGFQSPLQEKLRGVTGDILSRPPVDIEAQKAAELAKFDVERSQGIEEFKRATGGIAGSSQRQEELLNRMTSGAFDRSQLGTSLDDQLAKRQREELLTKFDIGSKAVAQEQGFFKDEISTLLQTAEGAAEFKALGLQEKLGLAEIASRERIQLNDQQFTAAQNSLKEAHETALQANDIDAAKDALKKDLEFRAVQAELGRVFTTEQSALDRTLSESLAHLDIDGQREFINLRSKLDTNQLLTRQEFEGAEAAMDRALEEALQSGNLQHISEMQNAQNEFDTLKEENRQRWSSAERAATQGFASGERISQQEFEEGMQFLDHQNRTALLEKDQAGQQVIQGMRNDLELKLQLQDMGHDESMLRLDAMLVEAKAKKDNARMGSIMQYQNELDMRSLQQQNKYAESLALVKGRIEGNLQDGNFKNASLLQRQRFNQEIEMMINDNRFREADLELQKRGIDLNEKFQRWNEIQQSIANGQASPESGLNWLKKNLPPELSDIIQAPDPFAVQKAINEDFLLQQLQFSATHPNSALKDKDGNFIGLTDESQIKFNEWFNENFYKNPEKINETLKNLKPLTTTTQKKELKKIGSGEKPDTDNTGGGNTGDGFIIV